MWIDLPGWQAQSSYVQPVAPPGTDPEAAPLVCLSFNQTWLPYVIGSLMQLVQPAAWDTSDPTVLNGVLQDAQTLIQLFGGAEACTMLTFQFTDTCVLQFSLDGGVTWQDVAGWPTNAPGCYTGAPGPTGATGAPGPPFVGQGTPPPNPQGVSVAQQACNIAGYLATEIIQGAISGIVDQVNAAEDLVAAVTAVFQLIPGIDVVWDIAVGAGAVLYKLIRTQGTSEYTTALGDPTLWSDVTCAIYGAISAAGYVTDANYAALAAAVAAISYTSPDVISAIAAYIAALGALGLEALQPTGALSTSDCSGCSSPPLNALAFNAVSSGLVTMASDIVFGTGALTIGWWYAGTTSYQGGYDGSSDNIVVVIATDTEVITDVRDATSTDHSVNVTGLASGTHHQVMYTFAGAGGAIEVYRDGVLIGSGTGPAGSVNAAGGHTTLGGVPGFGFFTGDQRGLAVYVGAVLTSGDAAAWYAAGPNAAPPGTPSHYYPTTEGTGATLGDIAGVDDGTLSVGVGWTHFP